MAHARKPKPETKKQQRVAKKTTVVVAATAKTAAAEDVRRLAHVAGQKIQVQTLNAGMARTCNRPSVFLPLEVKGKEAEDFMDRFNECWEEHIEGFGSVGKKRERNEMELSMEWRARIKTKQELVSKAKTPVANLKKNGQTVSEQDRLQAIQKYREMQERKKLSAVPAAKRLKI
ncbi:hypothetical protein BASA81_004880 [Batrachochytrium salamandrivorans]|nr:hypothetical protein BASA81_004880 [Batrachochytrium salamandrivorans]